MTRYGKPVSYALAASLLTLAAVQAVRADTPAPNNVTIGGATLFLSFFTPGTSSTNDFIDVNSNGISQFNPAGTPYVEQLAPAVTFGDGSTVTYATGTPSITETPYWNVQYRSTGSVGGIQEMLNTAAGVANPLLPLNQVSQTYINGVLVTNGGAPVPGITSYNANSGVPSALSALGAAGVDIATSDVRASWGLQTAGTPVWNNKPTNPGYGTNPLVSNTGYTAKVVSLTVPNGASGPVTFNLNTTTPNSQTIFSTPVAISPINFVANPGVGVTQLKATQLQQLYVTGRMATGENLVAVTRSILSGTRNGSMNSIGIDPSFAVGENIGNNAAGPAAYNLGATYQPGNYDGSGDVEAGLTNSRLGIGYDGSDRATSKSGNGTKFGSLKVMFDNEGGTQYVQETVSSIIHNSDPNTGWRSGGSETFITVGDPNATAINASYPALNTNPQMANPSAAAYIRNITGSIAAYTGAPTSDTNYFMPADTLTTSFLLQSAADYVQKDADGTSWIPNPNLNASVQAQALLNGTFNAPLVSGNGVVPTRTALSGGNTYSDGQTAAYRFYDSTGALQTIAANQPLNDRNKIAGDFNNTGLRDINQIPELMNAVKDPAAWAMAHNSGTTGSALGNAAIPEILGDFNGDGNFNAADVRYFADGLAIRTTNGTDNTASGGFNDTGHLAGNLDRRAGFVAVDTNWTVSTPGHPAGNYFNTQLATGTAYRAGDSRGDVAGSVTGPTAGAAPTGADGIINYKDIDYVVAQIKAATGQSTVSGTSGTDPNLDVNGAFSTLLTRAAANPNVNVRADLSADINGDMAINKLDENELVQGILNTHYGDANTDGVVNGIDLGILAGNFFNSGALWEQGDFNGDGVVNGVDLGILAGNFFAGAIAAQGSASPASSVPEPTSLAMLALGATALLSRRRREHA